MKRKSLSLLLVLLFAVSALSGCATSPKQDLWGRADAKEIDVTSKIPGRVVSLLVKEGDCVEAGQLLARIDNRDIVAKANQAQSGIQAVEAQLAQASTVTMLQDQTLQNSVHSAQAQLSKAESDLSLATKEHDRFKQLLADGAISQSVYDKYLSQY